MRGLRLLLVVGAVLGLAGCGGSDCGEGTHDKDGTCVPDYESAPTAEELKFLNAVRQFENVNIPAQLNRTQTPGLASWSFSGEGASFFGDSYTLVNNAALPCMTKTWSHGNSNFGAGIICMLPGASLTDKLVTGVFQIERNCFSSGMESGCAYRATVKGGDSDTPLKVSCDQVSSTTITF